MPRRRKFSSEPLGDTVQRLMAENGHTYRGLAEATGLSAGYLNHIVHGNRPVPSNEVVERLAKALGVDAAHFREYRLRVVVDELEKSPELIDRLYKRYA
jgi:transcriptional regulator with XRE-family HTH domain